jgi:hypothetical protein
MHGARSFKELDVYILAVEFRREIVRLTSQAPACRDFAFVRQIRYKALLAAGKNPDSDTPENP